MENSDGEIPKFSVFRALRIVGDAWSLRIITEAFRGTRRFSDWQSALGIPKAVLSRRLQDLVDAGIFYRQSGDTAPRGEYRLAEAGLALWEILLAIREWQLEWYPNEPGMHRVLRHTTCGNVSRLVLTCSSCAQPLTPFNTQANAGPGSGTEMPKKTHARRRGTAALESVSGTTGDQHILQIFGDAWTPAIIATCFRGLRRFTELENYLNIPPFILSGRLKELVAVGILSRQSDSGGHARFHLTQKGLGLFPYISMLAKWGDRWLDDGTGVPLIFHHVDCGCQYTAVFRCSACSCRLNRREVQLEDL